MNELTFQKNAEGNALDSNSGLILSLNEKDNRSDYFSERAKKLATAVYIVTNLIPQTDPLRVAIRKFSIRLLSFMGLSLSSHSQKEISAETIGLSKKIVEMLEIAFFSGYISEMNFTILKSEFDLFINEISTSEGSQKTLSQNSLKVSGAEERVAQRMSEKMSLTETSRSHSQSLQSSEISKGQKLSSVASPKAQKGGPASNFISGSNFKNTLPTRSAVEVKKMSRKEAIISIIKMKGSVSIKDISTVVSNCSEKTIQRELMMLVADGVLKKSGERRWSVYSLAN